MIRFLARLVALLLAVLVGATIWMMLSPRSDDQFADCRTSQIAGGAGTIGGPFTLVDQTGRTVTDADVIQKPSLLYFGYTFCPDVCPLDMARNAEAVDILEELGFEVTPVFISVDPKRDTPDVLADFVANLHPAMIGLTGSEDQVRAASQAYKTYFNVQDGDEEFYLIDHTTLSYLVLPGHGFVEFFRREVAPDEMANRVACFIDKA